MGLDGNARVAPKATGLAALERARAASEDGAPRGTDADLHDSDFITEENQDDLHKAAGGSSLVGMAKESVDAYKYKFGACPPNRCPIGPQLDALKKKLAERTTQSKFRARSGEKSPAVIKQDKKKDHCVVFEVVVPSAWVPGSKLKVSELPLPAETHAMFRRFSRLVGRVLGCSASSEEVIACSCGTPPGASRV